MSRAPVCMCRTSITRHFGTCSLLHGDSLGIPSFVAPYFFFFCILSRRLHSLFSSSCAENCKFLIYHKQYSDAFGAWFISSNQLCAYGGNWKRKMLINMFCSRLNGSVGIYGAVCTIVCQMTLTAGLTMVAVLWWKSRHRWLTDFSFVAFLLHLHLFRSRPFRLFGADTFFCFFSFFSL